MHSNLLQRNRSTNCTCSVLTFIVISLWILLLVEINCGSAEDIIIKPNQDEDGSDGVEQNVTGYNGSGFEDARSEEKSVLVSLGLKEDVGDDEGEIDDTATGAGHPKQKIGSAGSRRKDGGQGHGQGHEKGRHKNVNKRHNNSNSGGEDTSTTWRTSSISDGLTLVPLFIPSSSEEGTDIADDDITVEEDQDEDDDPLNLADIVDLYEETQRHDEGDKQSETNGSGRQKGKEDKRPNIILILTDDQDVELGSMEYMPETLKLFRDQGIEMRHGYVTTPMCCPSRSSMLTGLYVHNHQVYTNNDNCSSIHWREQYEKKTFASYLWDSGYYTSYIGKYLNKYDGSHIPYGWDEWNALLMNSKFYNYTVNRNGVKIRYGNNYQNDYYPDSIANDTINFLQRMAYVTNFQKQQGQNSSPDINMSAKKRYIQQPFLLVASFPSPHGPEDSAPEYSQMFLNTTSHHTPSYNYAPNADKQWILRVTSKMNPTLMNFTNLLMSKRLQTLQSVDLAVKNIMKVLRESGLAENTYVFYTSDHGYHVGQFGLIKGKSMPYEFDIRVPFYLSPPQNLNVPGGTMIAQPVLNIDLAPTFLELGKIPVPRDMDGRSFLPLIKQYSYTDSDDEKKSATDLNWTHTFLIESSGRREGHHSESQKRKTTDLQVRKSATERFLIDNETTAAELALCQLHPYPCQVGQKKYCRTEKNRMRFRKCRPTVDFIPYDIVGNNGNSTHQCICTSQRVKRSIESELSTTTESVSAVGFNWEYERQRIDLEIENLKLRIEQLRERRRKLRRQWMINEQMIIDQEISERLKDPLKNKNPQHAAFVPISPTMVKRKKLTNRIHNNAVPLLLKSNEVMHTTTEINNDTGNLFILPPKMLDGQDQKTFLGAETTFHSSGEVFDTYDDEDLEEDDDDDDFEASDYSATLTVGTNGHSKHQQNSRTSSDSSVLGKDAQIGEAEAVENGETQLSIKKSKGSAANLTESQDERSEPTLPRRKKNKVKVGEVSSTADPEPDSNSIGECVCNGRQSQRWLRQQEREERKRKKLLSKLRKKQRFLHRINDPSERHQAETCGSEDRMNCFWHDQSHWRTEPKWTLESFCFCMNANNNSYSCIRTVNATHNFLYCHFITGFKMYFDITQDPYQLLNTIGSLPAHEEDSMLETLIRLKSCKGRQQCATASTNLYAKSEQDQDSLEDKAISAPDIESSQPTRHSKELFEPSIWERIFGRWRKKQRKHRNQSNNQQTHHHYQQNNNNGRNGRKFHKSRSHDS